MRRLLLAAVLALGALGACARTLDNARPCDGVNDPRYSCRAVPVLRPETVRAE